MARRDSGLYKLAEIDVSLNGTEFIVLFLRTAEMTNWKSSECVDLIDTEAVLQSSCTHRCPFVVQSEAVLCQRGTCTSPEAE